MFAQIYSDILKKSTSKLLLLNLTRQLYETHYDVLKLKTDCTSKEIKDSFIKLSKQYHPDINKNKESHDKFLKINEAYKVLGKAESRRYYDLGLSNPSYNPKYEYYSKNVTRNATGDPAFWTNRDKSKDAFYKNRPYYGIKGINKVSNAMVLMVCFVVVSIGVGLQVLAISKSLTFQRKEMIRKSDELKESLIKTKEIALKNGNQLQIELLRKRFEKKSNE